MRLLAWIIAAAGLCACYPAARAVAVLAAARAEHATIDAARAAGPPRVVPLVSGSRAIAAADRPTAQAVLARLVRARARAGGVLVEQLGAVAGRDGAALAHVQLRASGSEKAMLALLGELERERPLVRLRSWRLHADADGRLTLDGELVAPWR